MSYHYDGIPDTEIDLYWNKARNHLLKAQVECEESLKLLSTIRSEMDSCQKSRLKLQFILNCLVNQVEFFSSVILEKCIAVELLDNEWSKVVLVGVVKDLNYWQDEITNKINALKNTKYDLNAEYKSLADFICEDHVEILQQKLDEVPFIKKQVSNIRQHYKSIKEGVQYQLKAGKVKKLKKYYETHFSRDNHLFELLEGEYLTKLNSYESDLTDYIRSITDHFDKCSILKADGLPPQDLKDLFEVLKNDDAELEHIRELIYESDAEITQFYKNVEGTITSIKENVADFYGLSTKIMVELEKCEEYVSIFQDIAKLVSVYKESCIRKIEQVQELCEVYDKFKKAYFNLLKERERRKSVAIQMKSILDECKGKLMALNEDDLDHRQQFLHENGDYLPENIWPGKIDDMAPLYSLEYTIYNEQK